MQNGMNVEEVTVEEGDELLQVVLKRRVCSEASVVHSGKVQY